MTFKGWNLPKPLWVATAAGILLLVLQFGIGGSFLSSRLEAEAFGRMKGELATGQQQLEKNAARYQHQAEAMAANLLIQFQGRNGIQLQQVEQAAGMFRPEKPRLTLLSVHGHPVATNQSGPVPNQIGMTKAFRESLAGKVSCSHPHLLNGTKGLVIAFYHPLRDQEGEIQRVARQYVLLKDLAPEFESEGQFIWLDEHGDVLVGKDVALLSDFADRAEGWSANQSQGTFKDKSSGKQVYFVQAPLGDLDLVSGGRLVFVTPKEVVLATMGPLRQLILGSVGVVVALALLIAAWLRYRRSAAPPAPAPEEETRTKDFSRPAPAWWSEFGGNTSTLPFDKTSDERSFGGFNSLPWPRPPTIPGHELLEVLGSGGFGCVFRAKQTSLNRIVAIKVLFPQLAQDVKYRRRLMQEGQVLAQLEHEHIVRVLEVGGDEQTMWMSMEHIEGKTLKDHIKKGVPTTNALIILDQVCAALAFAHDKGIVHRDIKPSNILIDENGRVRMVDFGLAKVKGSPLLTATGHGMGTPGYMAPEQLASDTDVDERADMYGLGVVSYQLLTGFIPTPGAKRPSELNDTLPQEIDALIMSCMRSDPEERPQSVAGFRQELRKITKQPTQKTAK